MTDQLNLEISRFQETIRDRISKFGYWKCCDCHEEFIGPPPPSKRCGNCRYKKEEKEKFEREKKREQKKSLKDQVEEMSQPDFKEQATGD